MTVFRTSCMRISKELRFLFLITIIDLCLPSVVQAQHTKDSTIYKNAVKLDMVPLYFDFFDTRKQIRIGFEYERRFTPRGFLAFNFDVGMFDDYDFIKYHDFFNQTTGFYATKTHVKNYGIHFMPSYNYLFWKARKMANTGLFASGIIDFHYYQKILNSENGLDGSNYTSKYFQTCMGAGFGLGGRVGLGRHFFIDLRSSLLGRVFRVISIEDVPQIKPLNATWTNRKYTIWWVNSLQLSYAF